MLLLGATMLAANITAEFPIDLLSVQKRVLQRKDRTKTGAPVDIPHEDVPSGISSGRRYAGNGVTVTYSFYWAHVSEYDYEFDSTCILRCTGQKHFSHKTCDLTCDKICLSTHKATFKPKFTFTNYLNGKGDAWAAGAGELIGESGGRASQASNIANQIKEAALKSITDKIDDYTYEYKSGHWNKTPCSVHDRDFRYTKYSLFAHYVVFKDGVTIKRKATSTDLLGTIQIPHKKFYEQKPVEHCQCEFIKSNRRNIRVGGLVPLEGESGHSGEGSGIRVGGLFIDPDGTGEYALNNENVGSNVSVEYRLDSLNRFFISATNTSMMPIGLALMPGSSFDPKDDSFQTMVNLDQLEFTVPSWSTREWQIPASGPSQDPIELKGFMGCLNMSKKAPDGKAVYSLGSTLDSRLIDMGFDMAEERFRGPWNQAQLWIYQDGASRKEINDRLLPPVSRSRYLNGLYALANDYQVDLNDEKYKNVWSPELVLADGVLYEQTEWFVNEMTSRDARALANWVKGNAGEFSYLFASDAQEWYIEHIVNLANALCRSSHVEIQAAGLNFLSRFVPQGKRAELIAGGGLEGAVALAIGDGKNASPAMTVVEQYSAELALELKTVPAKLPFPDLDPPSRSK